MLYVWTTEFTVNEKGIILIGPLKVMNDIPWDEIEDIKTLKWKTAILELKIFIKNKGSLSFGFTNPIKNHKEFFDTILTKLGKI